MFDISKHFVFRHCVQTCCGTQPSVQREPGAFSPGMMSWGMKLTTHLYLVPGLIFRGIIPPLLQFIFMAWYLIKQEIRLHGTGTNLHHLYFNLFVHFGISYSKMACFVQTEAVVTGCGMDCGSLRDKGRIFSSPPMSNNALWRIQPSAVAKQRKRGSGRSLCGPSHRSLNKISTILRMYMKRRNILPLKELNEFRCCFLSLSAIA